MVTRWAALAIVLAATAARADPITLHSEADVRSRANDRSRVLVTLDAGETVHVIAQRTGWLRVRARGRTGWISHEHVIELDEPPEAAIEEPLDDSEPEATTPEPAKRGIDLELAAGLSVLTQGLRTAGSQAIDDNYNIGVTAAALATSARYVHSRGDHALGMELAYTYRTALAGIRQIDPQLGQSITTAFSVHAASACLVAGRILHAPKRVVLFARAGVRYHQLRIAGARDPALNPARIPSELQLSPTLGVELVAGTLAEKLALGIALDTYLVGVWTRQTPGQEDGTRARARGATLESTVAYRWKPDLDLRFAHRLDASALDFGAPDPMSARVHGGTAVTRFDVAHSLTIGIAKRF